MHQPRWHEARIPTIATSVPRGAFSWVTKKLKEEADLDTPLVATNRINMPQVVEDILSNGHADLVSMARPFLADAEFVNKVSTGRRVGRRSRRRRPKKSLTLLRIFNAPQCSILRHFCRSKKKAAAGRPEDVNTCIGCNQACLDHTFKMMTASCLVNPVAGYEQELSPLLANKVPASRRLSVAVVGAGPAGLAAACTAAERGHAVTYVFLLLPCTFIHSFTCAFVLRWPLTKSQLRSFLSIVSLLQRTVHQISVNAK